MMVNFSETHSFYMKSKLQYLLLFVVASQLIKPFPFTLLRGGSLSVDLIFMIMLGSKEHSHHFFSSTKITLILTFILMNLQIYRTTLHSPY
jgi:hypothetical protein